MFVLPVAAMAACAAVLWHGGCNGQNAAEVSADLSGSLTETMSFTNGATVTGAPPAEHKDSASHPQTTSVYYNGPGLLKAGDTFKLVVKTDFKNADAVTGASLYVVNKEGISVRHFQVWERIGALNLGVMTLNGTLKDNSWLAKDQEFTVMVALGTGTGGGYAVGNYKAAKLTIKGVDLAGKVCNEPLTVGNCKDVLLCVDETRTTCGFEYGSRFFKCDGCGDSVTKVLDCGLAYDKLVLYCKI